MTFVMYYTSEGTVVLSICGDAPGKNGARIKRVHVHDKHPVP